MSTGAVEFSPVAVDENALCLQQELNWLARCIELRLHSYFQQQSVDLLQQAAPPQLSATQGCYADFVLSQQLSATERLIVLLALAPHNCWTVFLSVMTILAAVLLNLAVVARSSTVAFYPALKLPHFYWRVMT